MECKPVVPYTHSGQKKTEKLIYYPSPGQIVTTPICYDSAEGTYTQPELLVEIMKSSYYHVWAFMCSITTIMDFLGTRTTSSLTVLNQSQRPEFSVRDSCGSSNVLRNGPVELEWSSLNLTPITIPPAADAAVHS